MLHAGMIAIFSDPRFPAKTFFGEMTVAPRRQSWGFGNPKQVLSFFSSPPDP